MISNNQTKFAPGKCCRMQVSLEWPESLRKVRAQICSPADILGLFWAVRKNSNCHQMVSYIWGQFFFMFSFSPLGFLIYIKQRKLIAVFWWIDSIWFISDSLKSLYKFSFLLQCNWTPYLYLGWQGGDCHPRFFTWQQLNIESRQTKRFNNLECYWAIDCTEGLRLEPPRCVEVLQVATKLTPNRLKTKAIKLTVTKKLQAESATQTKGPTEQPWKIEDHPKTLRGMYILAVDTRLVWLWFSGWNRY